MSRERPDYKISGILFFGCEVCWTCRYFAMKEVVVEGTLTPGCYWNPFTSNVYNKALPTVIKKPGWWRCTYWTEKDENEV